MTYLVRSSQLPPSSFRRLFRIELTHVRTIRWDGLGRTGAMCGAFLCALVAASTALILLMTRTGAGESTGPSSLAALCHWMGRTYGAQYGTGDTSPNLSLIWYLKIEVFPEMAPTFLTIFHAQPLLVAAPLYWGESSPALRPSQHLNP